MSFTRSRKYNNKTRNNANRNSEGETQRRDFTKERGFSGCGKITAVDVQKTNPDRVNIFIDEQYAFSLSMIVAAEQRVRPGMELSLQDVVELQAADVYSLGLAAALEFISLRPRSEAEVRQRLRRRYPDAPVETFSRILARLKELNYLNDTDFAKYWIENRQAFAPRGRQLLKQELMQKGVARDIIDTALENYLEAATEELEAAEGESDGPGVEERQALELARKKGRSHAADDWAGFYRKLGGYLLRRGYDYGIAGRVTKQVWQELKGSASAADLDEAEF